jgi:hypothetical protein
MKKYLIICVLIGLCSPIFSLPPLPKEQFLPAKAHIYFGDDQSNTGFFHLFIAITGALRKCEQGLASCVTVNFGKFGLYYSPEMGDNWWSYYFEPIKNDSKCTKNFVEVGAGYRVDFVNSIYNQPREGIFKTLSKHVKVKEPILKIVEDFERDYFQGRFVIGVHYRATDKFIAESIPITPGQFFKILDKEMAPHLDKDPLIFIATDDAKFLEKAIKHYPGRIVFASAERSSDGKPLHLKAKNPYQQGKEALIDCLLLAKTQLLLRTSSNLSLVATWFGPKMPVIVVNPNPWGY